jgi:hypothetical protein
MKHAAMPHTPSHAEFEDSRRRNLLATLMCVENPSSLVMRVVERRGLNALTTDALSDAVELSLRDRASRTGEPR